MPEHIKAFLLASSLAFGIPTFMEEAAPSPRWLRQLELSDAQRDEIFRIFRDQAQARGLAEAEGKAQCDMALMQAETMSRVAAVLTPEQLVKLRTRKALRDFTFA